MGSLFLRPSRLRGSGLRHFSHCGCVRRGRIVCRRCVVSSTRVYVTTFNVTTHITGGTVIRTEGGNVGINVVEPVAL